MRRLTLICNVAVLVLAAGSAQADIGVWTFDELSGSGSPVPNGYGGFNWSNMYYLNPAGSVYAGSGYRNGMVSSPNVAYNAYGSAAAVSDGVFDFAGAYLTAAWRDGLNITVNGYSGTTLLYTQTVTVNHTGPNWFSFNYYGIDKLEFSSSGGTEVPGLQGSGSHFAMDDFTVVPVPGAVALGILGLGAVGVKLRKFA